MRQLLESELDFIDVGNADTGENLVSVEEARLVERELRFEEGRLGLAAGAAGSAALGVATRPARCVGSGGNAGRAFSFESISNATALAASAALACKP